MIGWRILCGGLVFVAVTTVAAAGAATLSGHTGTAGAWIALAPGAAAAIATARGSAAPRGKVTAADAVLFVVLALASLRAFLWVLYPREGELRVLSPHNLGDMALHLNLINRWANGGTFWPDNPFLAAAPFAYHPGMDLWNAVLRIAGVPLIEGLRWTGLLGAAAAGAALWRWGRGFAIAGFLFAGGLGALAYFQNLQADAIQADIAWKNLFLSIFVTQRGMLYSLPAGLVLMSVWRAQLRGEREGPSLPPASQVAHYASMPLFNAPAFMFLSALLAACALAGWRRRLARPFIVTGLASVIPATWLVRMVTANFSAPSFLRFAPGWMQGDAGAVFWIENFGIFLPLVVILGVVLFRRGGGDIAARTFYAAGAGTLLFCFLFLIAPWAWDNTKLMVWGYLALLPFLWSDLIGRRPEWMRAVVCLLLFSAGAVSLIAGLDARHGYELADRAELGAAQVMLRKVRANARLACAPGYDHPALLLGQPLVMGYDGHLYSQGLDYAPTERELDRLMGGSESWREAARRLQVHYIFWGPREARRWPSSPQPWKDCARILTSSQQGTLYLITPCLLED